MTTKLYRLAPYSTTVITAAAMRLTEAAMEHSFGQPVEERPDADDLRRIARKRHCSLDRARALWADGKRG